MKIVTKAETTRYHVQHKVGGEWQTVATTNWLTAQRLCDKLQNKFGQLYVRIVP